MLRRGLTWLRATWLAQVLPLDQNIQFHQLMGYVVVALSLVHTVAHVVNFGEWPGTGGGDPGGPFPSPQPWTWGTAPVCPAGPVGGEGVSCISQWCGWEPLPVWVSDGEGWDPQRKGGEGRAHLCLSPALQAQSEASPFRFGELLLTTRPGVGWVHGSASPTGVALLLLLLLMLACSSSCIRRSGRFEVSSPCPFALPGWAPLFIPCCVPSHYCRAQEAPRLVCTLCVCDWVVVYVCQVENALLWKILPFCWPAPYPNWIRLGSGRGRSRGSLSILIYKVDL